MERAVRTRRRDGRGVELAQPVQRQQAVPLAGSLDDLIHDLLLRVGHPEASSDGREVRKPTCVEQSRGC